MIRNTQTLVGILMVVLLMSCEKEELPKPIIDIQGSVYQTLEMGEEYTSHIGFSLQSSEVYQINSIDWDLYIYPNREVRINTSRFMKVLEIDEANRFEDTFHDSVFVYDDYSNEESDFKIKLTDKEQYYIIDLGRNIVGEVLQKVDCKMKLVEDKLHLEYKQRLEDTWKLKILDLSASSGVFFSFLTEETMFNNLFVESDFYCGGYITRFVDADLDYLVRGVLLNMSNTIEIAIATDLEYEAINLSNIAHYNFSKHIDKIGYDWKVYDLDKGLYIIDQSKVYVIRYANGLIYKLKFIDYYNSEGKKGYPMISFELLK